jgi:hypothetical protein
VKGKVLVEGEGKGRGICLTNFLSMYEYGTLKPVEIILRKGKENNGEDDPNWDSLYTCIEISQ